MAIDGSRLIPCTGWWEQAAYGRQLMIGLRLGVEQGRINGLGTDIIGPFTLTGAVANDGAVAMCKQYIDQHSVDYLGTYDGEGVMSGEWRIGPFCGRWMIALGRVSDGELVEIKPIPPQ